MVRKSYLLYSIITLSLVANSIAANGNLGWTQSFENPKVFIENKGQFSTNNPAENVLFAYDDGSTMIYFTSHGLVYRLIQEDNEEPENEKEREREEREKKNNIRSAEDWKKFEDNENKRKYKVDYIRQYWENSNTDVEIQRFDQTEDYYSYTFKDKSGEYKNINFINGFKKIVYKNIYDNIDIEYVFHPQNGIKYNLILRPGANISSVSAKYDRKGSRVKRDGSFHIPTLFGDIIEHAPVTYYKNNSESKIPSYFINNGNLLVFKLEKYNISEDVVVDPWVQTPTMSNSNAVWECERDGAGNVYIIGGDTPMRLRKYNSSGTMQWTYNTPWDTAGGWLGTLATDLAGNSYVTNGSNAVLQKINSSGTMIYSASGGSMDEYWNISFNCDQTKLIVGGTRLSGFPSPNGDGVIFDINTSNGSVNGVQIVGKSRTHTVFGLPVTDIEEVRSMTPSKGAKYYFLTLDSIGAISQDFSVCPNSTNLFCIDHTYGFGYKCENYRPSTGNSGMKSIKANGNFVYTQNGSTIHKRSLANGSVIATASIAGGSTASSGGYNQAGNSGLDIDSCGNVYVGSGNAVIKYDANLNQLSSTSLPFHVFDVAVSINGDVIVSGATGTGSSSSRTGYVQSINMSACNPMTLVCCDATICPVGPYCTNDPVVTLTPSQAGGTWSGPGITNASTGTFNPATAGPGLHTIIYTLPCGSDSIKISVSCCGASINPVGNFCVADAPTTLSAVQSGGTWSGAGITNASTGAFDPATAGVGTHTIVYTLAGCGSDSVSISVGACVSLTACQETNGNITATSGSAPFNWYNQGTTQDCSSCTIGCVFPPGCAVNVTSWTSFATGTTITPSGTYPVKLLDNNGDSLIITSLSSLPNCPTNSCPTITIDTTNIESVSCPGLSDGSFDASSSGGVSPWDYTLKTNGGTVVSTLTSVTGVQHFTGLSAGTYTLITYDANNCADSLTIIINTLSGGSATANAGSDQTVCSNSALLAATAPGSGTGTWTIISGTGTITTPSSATSAITGLSVGTVVLQWTVTSGCASASDTVNITNTGGGPTVTISAHTDITCHGNADGSATATATGGTGTLTYSWSPAGGTQSAASNLSAGTYTVSVTDGGGCTAIETVVITEPTAIAASVTATAQGCGAGALGSATVTASGGTGTLSYLWSNSETSATISNLSAGTYSVTVTDASGCTATANGSVSGSGGVIATAYPDNDTIGLGDTLQLFASGGSSYLWTPSANLSCSSCRNPIASPEETTLYCVIASDNGCSDTACITVFVNETDCSTNFLTAGSVYVPNSFTPGNHDYLNDVFKPVVNCVHDYNFSIFDRWGEKLFETNDVDMGWNGFFKGKLCQPDVYVYKVTFIDNPRSNFHSYIGRVTLLK